MLQTAIRQLRRPTLRRLRRTVGVALLGAAAALIVLSVGPPGRGRLGPGEVTLRARIGAPRTVLEVPPLGTVSASTHPFPLTLLARVDELDVDSVQQLIKLRDPIDRLQDSVDTDIPSLVVGFAVRALGTALLVGAIVGAVLPHRRWSFLGYGALGGVLGVTLMIGGAWSTYDASAFREPRFEGPIERAPAILRVARRHVRDIADVRRKLETLGDSVAELYAATATDPGGRFPDETRILHISDVHSNPVGLELARRLAAGFEVDAVLDTGDLTSFGLPIEARLGELLAGFGVPYLFVPGNHDSGTNRRALARAAGVHVFEDDLVHVGPLRILGVADPTFTASNEVSTENARETKRARSTVLNARIAGEQPDVVAVHDPELVSAVSGGVPLVVSGHTHKRSSAQRATMLVLTVGSAGATGLGSFTVETQRPYEAEILTFSGRRLVAVDYVFFAGLGGNFRVERRLIEESPPARVVG